MADIADMVQQTLAAAQGAQAAVTSVANNVAALTAAVQAIQTPPPVTVDFTPVLAQLTDLEVQVAAVAAQLVPTPPVGG